MGPLDGPSTVVRSPLQLRKGTKCDTQSGSGTEEETKGMKRGDTEWKKWKKIEGERRVEEKAGNVINSARQKG
jgi:hypothetical protein